MWSRWRNEDDPAIPLPPSRGKVDIAKRWPDEGAFQRVARSGLVEPPPHPALRATFPRKGGRGNFLKRVILNRLLAARAKREAVALVTQLDSGAQRIIARDDAKSDPLSAVLDEAFRFDRSGVQDGYFVSIQNPPLRLVMIGAVHIAQAVIPIAQLAGYDIIVIDPRGAFATGARFPDVTLHSEWPDEILPRLGLDPRSALLALTHDPKIDDPALAIALHSSAFYIGALGSKKTHASRVARLGDQGFTEAEIARIHGPIGLAIGAKGAPEIAISILAEMTRALRLGA